MEGQAPTGPPVTQPGLSAPVPQTSPIPMTAPGTPIQTLPEMHGQLIPVDQLPHAQLMQGAGQMSSPAAGGQVLQSRQVNAPEGAYMTGAVNMGVGVPYGQVPVPAHEAPTVIQPTPVVSQGSPPAPAEAAHDAKDRSRWSRLFGRRRD